MYYNQSLPQTPLTSATPTKAERNAEIRHRVVKGELIPDLATEYGISEQRVHQIIRGKRK